MPLSLLRSFRVSAFATLLLLIFVPMAAGQNKTIEKFREKRDLAITAAEERRKAEQGENSDRTADKPMRTFVTNVDAQMAISKVEFNTFTEAAKNPATKISDGEPLWMYIKFKGKLGEFVVAGEPDEDGSPRYRLFLEIGPQGDSTSLNQFVLVFREVDLNRTEIKFDLASGSVGRNASIPLFLDRAAASHPGIWRNEFRLTNTTAVPRSQSMDLATSPFVLDLTKGKVKYDEMASKYDVVIAGGTGRLPVAGSFKNSSLIDQVERTVRSRGIEPIRAYFIGDEWMESAVNFPSPRRWRKATAVYTYRNADECFFGFAKAVQDFDQGTSKFTEPKLTFEKGVAIRCSDLN